MYLTSKQANERGGKMENFYIYEIFLDEMLVSNSGSKIFKTNNDATTDAMFFVSDLIENEQEFDDCNEDDFDINIYKTNSDEFSKGW